MTPAWHHTTICAVRRDGVTAVACDGQVTLGTTVLKHGATKLRRLAGGSVLAGLRRLGGRRPGAVRPLRGEARGVRRQPRAGRGRAGPRLAHRPGAAPPRGDDDRRRPRRRCCSSPAPARSSRRTTGCWRSAPAAPPPLAAARALRGPHRAAGAGDRPRGAAHRRRDRPLHQRPHHAWRWRRERSSLTPREIVAELDRYIVGQQAAKRAVAVALRNRWRRQQLPAELRREVTPANIILIGPTGVGKTEIARRLARLAARPFVKVEASKFTEVGYVGRDVDSIVRDLVEAAIAHGAERALRSASRWRAQRAAEDRLLDLLLPGQAGTDREESRRALRRMLREGQLEDREVEVEVAETRMPSINLFGGQGMETLEMNLRDALGGAFQKRERRAHVGGAGARGARGRGGRAPGGPARGGARGGVAGPGDAASCSSTRSTRSPAAARPAAAPTCRARGCSATSCRSSRAPRSPPATAPVRTDHVLFIAAGAFHVVEAVRPDPRAAGPLPGAGPARRPLRGGPASAS